MTNGTIPTMTPGQMKDLSAAIVQAIPTNLSFYQAKILISKKGEVQKLVRDTFYNLVANVPLTEPEPILCEECHLKKSQPYHCPACKKEIIGQCPGCHHEINHSEANYLGRPSKKCESAIPGHNSGGTSDPHGGIDADPDATRKAHFEQD